MDGIGYRLTPRFASRSEPVATLWPAGLNPVVERFFDAPLLEICRPFSTLASVASLLAGGPTLELKY